MHPTAARRSRGPARVAAATSRTPPATIATFDPDTAVRCVSPVACMASRSACGSSRVSPVTNPTRSPPVRSSRCRVAAVRTVARTASEARATPPACRRTSHEDGSRTADRCWRASHRPYPESGSGRAVAVSSTTSPSDGGGPSRVTDPRSRVGRPSTRSMRSTTCQPSATRRGSVATAPVSDAEPPWPARPARRPRSAASARSRTPAVATRATTTATAAPVVAPHPASGIDDRRRTAARSATASSAPAATRSPTACPGPAAGARTSPTSPPATAADAQVAVTPTTAPAGAVPSPTSSGAPEVPVDGARSPPTVGARSTSLTRS